MRKKLSLIVVLTIILSTFIPNFAYAGEELEIKTGGEVEITSVDEPNKETSDAEIVEEPALEGSSSIESKVSGNKIAVMADPHVPYAAIDGLPEHTEVNDLGKTVYKNVYDGTQADVFGKALLDSINRGAKAVLIPGDLTWNSKKEQYDLYNETINKYASEMQVVESMGNHDLASWNVKTRAKLRDLWKENIGRDVYYDEWVGDIHVICLGSDSDEPARGATGAANGSISSEQLDWLEDIVKEDDKSGITDIILCHWPVAGTYPATTKSNEEAEISSFLNEEAEVRLHDIVSSHDNVIFFSGHTHAAYKNADGLRVHETESGGTFVHAGIIFAKKPVYTLIEPIPSTDGKEYIISYIQLGKEEELASFTFSHDLAGQDEVVHQEPESIRSVTQVEEAPKTILADIPNEDPAYPNEVKKITLTSNIPEILESEIAEVSSFPYTLDSAPKAAPGYTFSHWTADKDVILTVAGSTEDLENGTATSFITPLTITAGEEIPSIESKEEVTETEKEITKQRKYVKAIDETVFTAHYIKDAPEREYVKVIFTTNVEGFEYLIEETLELKDGRTVIGTEPPVIPGYTFSHWMADKDIISVSSGISNEDGEEKYIETEGTIPKGEPIKDILLHEDVVTDKDGKMTTVSASHKEITEDTVFTAVYTENNIQPDIPADKESLDTPSENLEDEVKEAAPPDKERPAPEPSDNAEKSGNEIQVSEGDKIEVKEEDKAQKADTPKPQRDSKTSAKNASGVPKTGDNTFLYGYIIIAALLPMIIATTSIRRR